MRDAVTSLAGRLVLGLALAWPAGVRANDTMAAIGAGGLQFEKTDKLRMEREELYLSPLEVRVSYVFRNLTDQDVRGRVAFPMPVINVGEMYYVPRKFNDSLRDGNIFDFRAEVNGQPVAAEFDGRAYVNADDGTPAGKDITDLLKKHGVPLIEPNEDVITGEALAALLAADAFSRDGTDDPHASWSVKAAYHWTQVFPAKQEIRVTHRYKPVLGSGKLPTNTDPRDPKEADYVQGWCPDAAFAMALKKLPADSSNYVLTTWLEYILKTGANWAGPIGRFRLEIDKAGADLVSLCPIPGLKLQRRGQSFVAEATNYTPTADIKALFVYRACDKPPCGVGPEWPGYPR